MSTDSLPTHEFRRAVARWREAREHADYVCKAADDDQAVWSQLACEAANHAEWELLRSIVASSWPGRRHLSDEACRRPAATCGVALGDSVYLAVTPEADLNLEVAYLVVVDRAAIVDLAPDVPPIIVDLEAPPAPPAVTPEEPAGEWFRRTMIGS